MMECYVTHLPTALLAFATLLYQKELRMKEGAQACLSLPRAGQQGTQLILLL